MSQSKRRFLATLVVVVALAAVRRLDVETKEFAVLTPNSRLSRPVVAHDESLWYTRQPAYGLVRSNRAFHAISETPSNVFLPVQSQKPQGFGCRKVAGGEPCPG